MDGMKRKSVDVLPGRVSGTSESMEQSKLLRHLDDAIQLMPDSEKQPYLDAVHYAPQIVEKESNPLWFMRWEKFNAWSAAERLAAYWKLRKDLFGPDNYLKPMHQTGNGALSSEDIELLDKAFACILPKVSTSGQYVLWWDRDKLDSRQQLQKKSRWRVLFYMLHVILMLNVEEEEYDSEDAAVSSGKKGSGTGKGSGDNSTSSTDSFPGFIGLALLTSSLGANPDFEFAYGITDILRRFPLNISCIHLVSLPNSGSSIMSSLAALASRMLGDFFGKMTRSHSGVTMRELQQRLRDAGFDKRTLPAKIGGNWKEDKFEQFKRRRRRIEEEMFLSEEEKLKRKRQVNMIHSRQKRERRKIELEVLQEQCQELMHRNSLLRDGNNRLEDLLERAEAEIKISAQNLKQENNISYRPDDSLARSSSRFASLPLDSSNEPGLLMQQQGETNAGNFEILRKMLAMEQNIHEQQRTQTIQNIQNSLQLQQLLSAHGVQQTGDISCNLPIHQGQTLIPFLGDPTNFISDHNASNHQALHALAAALQNRANQAVPAISASHIFSTNANIQQLGLGQGLSLSRHGTQVPQASVAAVLPYGDGRSDFISLTAHTPQRNGKNSFGGSDAATVPISESSSNPNTSTLGFRPAWPW